jgi:hypothetical protein
MAEYTVFDYIEELLGESGDSLALVISEHAGPDPDGPEYIVELRGAADAAGRSYPLFDPYTGERALVGRGATIADALRVLASVCEMPAPDDEHIQTIPGPFPGCDACGSVQCAGCCPECGADAPEHVDGCGRCAPDDTVCPRCGFDGEHPDAPTNCPECCGDDAAPVTADSVLDAMRAIARERCPSFPDPDDRIRAYAAVMLAGDLLEHNEAELAEFLLAGSVTVPTPYEFATEAVDSNSGEPGSAHAVALSWFDPTPEPGSDAEADELARVAERRAYGNGGP